MMRRMGGIGPPSNATDSLVRFRPNPAVGLSIACCQYEKVTGYHDQPESTRLLPVSVRLHPTVATPRLYFRFLHRLSRRNPTFDPRWLASAPAPLLGWIGRVSILSQENSTNGLTRIALSQVASIRALFVSVLGVPAPNPMAHAIRLACRLDHRAFEGCTGAFYVTTGPFQSISGTGSMELLQSRPALPTR
jgi:hypothetical protein